MADGRQMIEEVYKTITGISERLEELKGNFSEDAFAEFEGAIESCLKWGKLCRGKVWLRTAEGTDRAQGCFDAAERLMAGLDNPETAGAEADDLAAQLESLARILATKSQIIT